MTVIGALSSFRELGKMSPHKRALGRKSFDVHPDHEFRTLADFGGVILPYSAKHLLSGSCPVGGGSLKSEKCILPVKESKASAFGRSQISWSSANSVPHTVIRV
jgi:hypothetical protein